MTATYLVNERLIRLDHIIIESRVPLSEGNDQVVDAKEKGEQSISRGPRHGRIARVGRKEFLLKLLLKTLHDIPEGRCYQRWIDRSSTKSQIIGLDVASIVCSSQKVHVIGTIGGSSAWICGISHRIRRAGLFAVNLKTRASIWIAAVRHQQAISRIVSGSRTSWRCILYSTIHSRLVRIDESEVVVSSRSRKSPSAIDLVQC